MHVYKYVHIRIAIINYELSFIMSNGSSGFLKGK